ncbi:MAG: mycothiol system anti-sigma-R factor [Propionibacteriaceae bacterium]|jgi:mycothiol system anti-sigma-R factor|nr:mycothiol system anti-sigma-R factor [Propionibacteriaceae bacterium]
MSEIEECRRTVERVYAFHDGELSAAEVDQIGTHLLACQNCLGEYEIEKAMRVLIKRSCGTSGVPESLHLKIKESLGEIGL